MLTIFIFTAELDEETLDLVQVTTKAIFDDRRATFVDQENKCQMMKLKMPKDKGGEGNAENAIKVYSLL